MPELALMDVTAWQRGRTVRLRVREFGRFQYPLVAAAVEGRPQVSRVDTIKHLINHITSSRVKVGA